MNGKDQPTPTSLSLEGLSLAVEAINKQYKGGVWANRDISLIANPGVAITDHMTGEVARDVTQDVLDGANLGWLVKHEYDKSEGKIWFYSSEGAANVGNPNLAPRLILEYQ